MDVLNCRPPGQDMVDGLPALHAFQLRSRLTRKRSKMIEKRNKKEAKADDDEEEED